MQYWFCSTGPVSRYLPWELCTLTFGLYVCIIAYIHTPSPPSIFQRAIASVRAHDLRDEMCVYEWKSSTCLRSLLLRLCPSVLICPLFSHSLHLASSFSSPRFQSSFLPLPWWRVKCRVEVTLSRPTSLSASALIILSIQTWKALLEGRLGPTRCRQTHMSEPWQISSRSNYKSVAAACSHREGGAACGRWGRKWKCQTARPAWVQSIFSRQPQVSCAKPIFSQKLHLNSWTLSFPILYSDWVSLLNPHLN